LLDHLAIGLKDFLKQVSCIIDWKKRAQSKWSKR
jgi:hypothetical protein